MLRQRLLYGALICAGVVLAACFLPVIGVWLLLAFLSSVLLLEFYDLLNKAQLRAYKYLGVISGVALITVTFAACVFGKEGCSFFPASASELQCCVLCLVVLCTLVRQFPQKHNDQPLGTIACTLMGVLYVPFLFNYFTLLVFSWGDESFSTVSHTGAMLVFYLIVVVKSGDTGALLAGSLLGRHKLFPRISPGKTWEGAVGAFLAAVAASFMFYKHTGGSFGTICISGLHAVTLGILLAGVGMIGDLVESLLKRAVGVKDSSNLVPGFGGLLDILDSLLFTAPVLYYYLRIVLRY